MLGAGCCVGTAAAAQAAGAQWLAAQAAPAVVAQLLISLAGAGAVLLAYYAFVAYYEKRRVSELRLVGFGRSMGLGVGLGLLLQAAVVGVMYLGGAYTVQAWRASLAILPALGLAVNVAVVEEILLRGLFFRVLEERLGSVAALVVSAVLFGGLHWGNPGSSLAGVLAVAVQAGVLLGAAFLYSRNLWLPIFLHFAWNFAEAGIFGAAVSGHASGSSLLLAQFKGPAWLTGGVFGPENSVQATVLCALCSVWILRLAYRQGRIKQPPGARP